jgi:hypothetical protein
MLDCGAALPFFLPMLLACPLVIRNPHLETWDNKQYLVETLEGANSNTVYVWQSTTNLQGPWQNCCPDFQGVPSQVFAFPVSEPQQYFRCVGRIP